MKILLMSKERAFLLSTEQKQFHSQYGIVDLTKIKKYSQKIKSSKGYEFTVVKPSIIDLLKKARRMPQIITPKDAGQIIAITGVSPGWKCLDLGSGSGFLAIFLGNIIAPSGSVVTYEKKKEFAENVSKNIQFCELDKIVKVKNKTAEKFTEKELDLISMDIPNAEKLVKKCAKALKPGGWLCSYSPHIEQQIKVRKEMEKTGFIFIKIIETTQRVWSSLKGYTHPRYGGIGFTGFITFGRKVSEVV